MKCKKCKLISRTVIVWFVSCVVLALVAGGCGGEDKESTSTTPKSEQTNPKPKPVAKYATPKEVFDAMHKARLAEKFDTAVACYCPRRLENEAASILSLFNFIASRDGIPADKVKEADEFLKANGFNGIADMKTPKDADAKVFVKSLLAKVKDKAALVADNMKRQAAHRASNGKDPFPAPSLKDVKITGDRAEGKSMSDSGYSMTYFEFIDGSWRSSLKPQ